MMDIYQEKRLLFSVVSLTTLFSTPIWVAGIVLCLDGMKPTHDHSMVPYIVGYAAIIITFLGGARLAIVLQPANLHVRTKHFTLSILAVFFSVLAIFIPPAAGICLLVTSFLCHALSDILVSDSSYNIPRWYTLMRQLFAVLLTPPLLISLACMLIMH